MKLKLYLISSPPEFQDWTGYDYFDSAVVAASSSEEAAFVHPRGGDVFWDGSAWADASGEMGDLAWPTPDQIEVTKIGKAVEGTDPGVVLASFNGG